MHVSLSVRVALLAPFFDDELASFVVYCSPKYNEKRATVLAGRTHGRS